MLVGLIPLLLANSAANVPALLASALVGAALTAGSYWFIRVLTHAEDTTDTEWRFDRKRIQELRRIDGIYRGAQPLIMILSRINRAVFPSTLVEMQRELQAGGLSRYWLAEEYLARSEILALLMLPVYAWLGLQLMGPPGVLMAITLTVVTGWLLRWRLRQQARSRLQDIKRRLPFFLDLLTLLMEAGSTFVQALADAVQEFAEQPIAVEFSRVLTDIQLGKNRTDAFQALRDRLEDNDITSLIGAIVQGESLGTPVAAVFRTQADVLRIKRTQSAETVAGEAGVNMLFPGILVMMAAVALILGPFLLNYLYFGLQF